MSVKGILSSQTSVLAEMFDIRKLMTEGRAAANSPDAQASPAAASAPDSQAATDRNLLKTLLRAEDQGANDYVPPDQAGRYEGASLMSRNFFKANYEKSRYTEASISRFGEEQGLRNKLDGLVSSMLRMADMHDMDRKFGDKSHPIDPKYVTAALMTAKSRQGVNQVMTGEVEEASDKNLEENRERIAEQTAAAFSPEALPAGEASAEVALAEAPEIATGSGKANAEIPAAQAQSSGVAAAYASIKSLAAPSASISLNISV